VEPTKYEIHEIKSESNENECDFDFNGEDLAGIKAELTIKMSDEESDSEPDGGGQADELVSSDSEDDEEEEEAKRKKKSSRTKKSSKKAKDSATQEKLKAIADKCKRSNEWGDAQEENIKQLCKMECNICPGTKFDKWLDMKKHYRVVHQMQGFVICSCCDGKFTKRFKILDHVVRKLNPEEFKCKICGKYYENRDSLAHHMGYHEPEDTRPYKCEVEDCQKTFTRRSQFLDHQIRHTPESEKKFACNVCGKR
jgi:Zinc finger, C2H2 type